MRKSNSKEARRLIEKYVMEQVRDTLDRMEQSDTARPVSAAYAILSEELAYQSSGTPDGREIMGASLAERYEAAGRHDHIKASTPYWTWYFAALIGAFEVYTDSTRGLVTEWLDQTPEEADRYDSGQVIATYCHLTAQAFSRLYERETTPHRIPTADFRALYDKRNGGHFFDRKTMKFFGQTMRDIRVYGFELVEDYDGTIHDCYRVESTGHIDRYRFSHTFYFDRATIAEVTPATAEEG